LGKLRKILSSVFCIVLIVSNFSMAQEKLQPEFKWQPGEDLFYSVKWSFINLGNIRMQVLKADSIHNRKVYHCRIYIDSNPSLPFVNLHDIYDSYIDAEDVYSHIFLAYEKMDNYTLYTKYDFKYDRNEVHIFIQKEFSDSTVTLLDSTGAIPRKVRDSLSLLFYARAMAKHNANMNVDVFFDNKFESTNINFTGRQENIKANDQHVPGYFLDGRLKFVGIAGVKDKFKGWFSPDSQSVPLKAYMKAFIGSVKLELNEWKNWKGETIFKKDD
jgi:hypothetical protein